MVQLQCSLGQLKTKVGESFLLIRILALGREHGEQVFFQTNRIVIIHTHEAPLQRMFPGSLGSRGHTWKFL
jgi:hypothetical protein